MRMRSRVDQIKIKGEHPELEVKVYQSWLQSRSPSTVAKFLGIPLEKVLSELDRYKKRERNNRVLAEIAANGGEKVMRGMRR